MGLSIAVLARVAARTKARPELFRKLVHIGAGFVAVSFAWLFEDTWPVVLLSLGGVLFVIGVRRWAPLKRTIGPLLHGVERTSVGDYCLPIVIPLIHGLAMPDRVLYIIPILVLTLADAAAALVGVRIGRLSYRTGEGAKTVEGSLAMALVSGLIVVIALSIDGVEPGRAFAIAAMIAMLITLTEAVCWRGLDNLVVPVATFALLQIYLEMPVQLLGIRFGVGLFLIGLAVYWHRIAGLIGAAGLAVVLVLYASWSLGGWEWLVAPSVVVASVPFLGARSSDTPDEHHGVGTVLSFGLGPLIWVLYNGAMLPPGAMLVPFVTACSAALGVIGIVRWRFDRAAGRCDRLLPAKLVLVVLGGAVLFGSVMSEHAIWLTVAYSLGASAIAAALVAVSPAERPGKWWNARWVLRAAVIVVVSAIPLVIDSFM